MGLSRDINYSEYIVYYILVTQMFLIRILCIPLWKTLCPSCF